MKGSSSASHQRGPMLVGVVFIVATALVVCLWRASAPPTYDAASVADDKVVVPLVPRLAAKSGEGENGAIQAWGYNSDRNVPRLAAIEAAIAADWKDASGAEFTLVDYGADQGYFSITLAHKFPRSRVISVEMGGVGGEIWKKKGTLDVIAIQEDMAKQHGVTNMRICQTKVLPTMFDALNAANINHRYQLVLSVFHWFELPTRAAFEHAITNLFKNAATTFIELPTIGDRSAEIRGQVGWKNFERWYDGRNDIGVILADAAKSANLRVRVTMLVSVPWAKWSRDLYRVDVEGFPVGPSDSPDDCVVRRKTYQCATHPRLGLCS